MIKKLIMLGCLSSCLTGIVQASDTNSPDTDSKLMANIAPMPITISAPNIPISDMACGGSARTYSYTVNNTGGAPLNLYNIKLITNSDDTFTAAAPVVAGTCVTNPSPSVAAFGNCTVTVAITPPTCTLPNTTPSLQVFDRTLSLNIYNVSQTQVTTPIEFDVTILGSAADFAIVTAHNLTNTNAAGTAEVVGNIAVEGALTGTPSILVTGQSFVGVGMPISANAVADATTANTFLAGLSYQSLGTGFSGTIQPGTYSFSGNATIGPTALGNCTNANNTITLDGPGDYIFYSSTHTLQICANTQFSLINGAEPDNVYWVTSTSTGGTITINGNGLFVGNILSSGTVAFATAGGVSPTVLEGRVLSTGTTVTLAGNRIVNPDNL